VFRIPGTGIIIFRNGGSRGGGSYDGEKIPGDLSTWNILSSDSNEILTNTYGTLVKRSATLYHTYPLVRAAINKQTEYAIGPGLIFRSQPDHYMIPSLDKNSAQDWGKQFQKIVHYYFQKFGFYETQQVMFRGSLTIGDSLLYLNREKGMLDDLIEFSGDQIAWEYNADNYTLGVKHDGMLRPRGVRLINGKDFSFRNQKTKDVQLIHYFQKEQPRQLRGYPLAYAVINLAKNDDRHTDAAVQRAVMESILIGSYETDSSNPRMQVENMVGANLKKQAGGANAPTAGAGLLRRIGNAFGLGAGNMFTFKKGEKINFTDLKTPNAFFQSFKDVMTEYVGAATGTPPEVVKSKYSTSYTAHRGALNDFRKSYMTKRSCFARGTLQPVIKEILKDAVLNGYIEAPGIFQNDMLLESYTQGNFLGPIPGSINPLQEVNAAKTAVEEAFRLRSDVSAEYGNEWDNFIQEWHDEQDSFRGDQASEKIFEEENNREPEVVDENN